MLSSFLLSVCQRQLNFLHSWSNRRWRFGAVGRDVGQINEVTLRRATGTGDRIGVQLLVWEIYLSLAKHPGQLSLAMPLCTE